MEENATTVTVRTGYVHPSDLEVSWDGQSWWVQVSHTARVVSEHDHHDTADNYRAGLASAREFLSDLVKRQGWSDGYVLVAQVNVTDRAAGSFYAGVYEPATEAVKAITTIEEVSA